MTLEEKERLLQTIIFTMMAKPLPFSIPASSKVLCYFDEALMAPYVFEFAPRSAQIIHHDFPKQPPRRPLFRQVIEFHSRLLPPYKA